MIRTPQETAEVYVLNAHMFGRSTEPGEHVDWSAPDRFTDLGLGDPAVYAAENPHMIVFELELEPAPNVWEIDHDDDEQLEQLPPGMTPREWQDVRSGISTSRALGSTGATIESGNPDGTRSVFKATRIEGTGRYTIERLDVLGPFPGTRELS